MNSPSLYHYRKAGEVASYIKRHASERELITLHALAVRFGICRTALMRAFKYRYKVTVHQFIIETRVRMAAEMISLEKIRIKKISYSLGYRELGHLTRDFKKVTGVAPTQYRMETSEIMEHKESV